jgi:DNA repair exonuclease SbcCD ATPase subunit
MNPSAHVTSIEGMADFQAALLTFTEKAKDALTSVELELRRLVDWIDDQAKHWQSEIRQAENAVFEAKNELARKKMMRISDRPPDTTDQEKALRKAQARLAYAEEKRDNTRKWLRQLPDAVEEYDGVARPFQDMLEYELTRMIALIAAKINALEDYQRIQGAGETP